MKYTIVSDLIISTENKVNKLIEEGWSPLGGVSFLKTGGAIFYAQAMIKKDDEDYEDDDNNE